MTGRGSAGGWTRRVRVLLLVALLGLFAAARADDDPAADFLAERARTVDRLRAHAAWCQTQGLAAERDRALESLVALEPDDAAARKALRHVREKDGTWRRPSGARPKPATGAKADEAAARFGEAVAPFREAVTTVRAGAPAALRERAASDLVGVLPDDADARAGNGEVRSGDAWVLVESDRARTRGATLRGAGRKSIDGAPKPESGAATAEEGAHGGPYPQVFSNAVVRVLGARGTNEAETCARTVAAMRDVYGLAIGREPLAVPGFRVRLYPDAAAGVAAVESDPRFDRAYVEWVRKLSGAWAPKDPEVWVWLEESDDRVEWTLRQSLQLVLRWQFRVTERQGCLYEGVGQWFSEAMLGRHRCVYVRQTEYADPKGPEADLVARLRTSGADWPGLARDLAVGKNWPDLRTTLGHDVNVLTAPELVQSFAFARYLIEGRPDDVADVLHDVGAGVSADDWCGARLGATVEGLSRRVRRFVRETPAR